MLLDFEKTKELLEKYHIPTVESLVIQTAEQGIEFADKVGFPVVLKLISSNVLHKVDKGLVKLNIQNKLDMEIACKELNSFLEERSLTPCSPKIPSEFSAEGFLGIVAQKQISGTELFVGMKRDKSFGPVISFGLGGIFVEVLKDVAFGICPIEKKEAQGIIKSIKSYKILEGFRGQKGVDVNKLSDVLVLVSRLAMENEEINEIDINPLFALGNEIMAVDVKIII
ncbi:MAG: acetate--CoA ligase family protein [Candidatus Pacebacteria bacterium]|nr:acetate--CoA ligase family protein [Candidatus Paceibacterota bacterium]